MRLLPAWGLGLLGSWWIARLQRSPESWARAAECTAPEARPLPAAEPVARCPPSSPWDAAPHIFSQRRTVMPCEPSPASHSPPEVTLRGQAETRCSFSPSKTPRQANRPLRHPWLPMCVLLQTALTIQLTTLHRRSHH